MAGDENSGSTDVPILLRLNGKEANKLQKSSFQMIELVDELKDRLSGENKKHDEGHNVHIAGR